KDDNSFVDFYNEKGMRNLTDNIRKYVYRKYKRRDVFYVWVVELQKRGVFHFHVLLIVPRVVYIPFLDKWLFTWGMTNIKELRGFGKYYLAKYLAKSKREEGEVDNDKSYQANYELMREKKKRLGVNQRFLGYSMKILHEVLRYQLDKLRYIKWFLSKVAFFPISAVVRYVRNENEKGFWFWGYRLYSMKKVFSFSELLGWLRCNFKHFALLPS
ncbi:MAG: rolling circle replication-associated protein, partial [Candidatus Aenigmatarchaeota archaeon]